MSILSLNMLSLFVSVRLITPERTDMTDEERSSRKRFSRLRIHYSWIAVILFVAVSVITEFSTTHSFLQRLLLGVIASLLFLLSAIIRDYILVFVAAQKGAPVKSVTVFAVGAVLHIERDTTTSDFELLLGVVGLLSNLVMGGLFFVVYQVLANTGSVMVHVVVQWLAFSWVMLGILGFVPGLPLDGGRIVRALLWKTTGKYEAMTRLISWVGWGFGILMALGGIAAFVTTRQWFVAILLVLNGFILQNAATHSRELGKWVQKKLQI